MPKIIEHLQQRLLEETQRQIEAVGYSGLTIRSVANACGVGVGTVYNYFSSKDQLVAAYLLTDWKTCIDAVQAISDAAETPAPVARCIYDQLQNFTHRHRAIFLDPAAVGSTAGSSGHYHRVLRSQLAAPLRKFCCNDFTAEFLAESLLTWTMSDKSFDEIYGVIEKLF